MDRKDIAEVLFSSIKEDDPYRVSKLLQIERWCYAHWKIHAGYCDIRNNFLAQVLSDKECWKKIGGLHGVKLDRQMVGKKLIAPSSDSNPNPFGTDRYKIACECCLEEDIIKMFEDYRKERNVENEDSLKKLVGNLSYGNPLKAFWSHVIGNYISLNNFNCTVDWKQAETVKSFWDKAKSGDYSKLNLKDRHLYEYGLDCAVDWKKVEAVEFFWNKIKSLSENEIGAKKKDRILMKNAVYSAGPNFRVYPDIFEFFLNQIDPDRYPELLKRDLEKNGHHGCLDRMKNMLSFDKWQQLFDCLKSSEISEDDYHIWLKYIEIQNYSGHYADAAKKLFMHIWTKEGFDSHRALIINEEVMDKSPFFHKNLLVRWVERDCMEPVWAVLDKLDSSQIKKFMTYKQADYIRSVLEQGDHNLLNRFLAYGKSTGKNLDKESVNANLAEVELSKVHDQSSYVGLGDH